MGLAEHSISASDVDGLFDQLAKVPPGGKLPSRKLEDFADALDDAYSANPLYGGDGFTISGDGGVGSREMGVKSDSGSFALNPGDKGKVWESIKLGTLSTGSNGGSP